MGRDESSSKWNSGTSSQIFVREHNLQTWSAENDPYGSRKGFPIRGNKEPFEEYGYRE